MDSKLALAFDGNGDNLRHVLCCVRGNAASGRDIRLEQGVI